MKKYAGKKAFIYARVSTKEQANNEISVSDQIAHGERWLQNRGVVLVKTFIEAGKSATRDNRGEFQAMIEQAKSDEHPVDIIVAHSQSRLFRNALDFLSYKAQLKPFGVNFVSLTQEFGDDPASEMAANMIAIFDEYQSQENGKHVKRTMRANAESGNWNGQVPPIGYKIVGVRQPKGKDRKKLEIDPETSHIPKFIFETYVNGTPEGPIGITALAAELNRRGERIRGKPFHVSNVQKILANTAYMGIAYYNKRCSRTGVERPQEEWIGIPVPPLVSETMFAKAQSIRASRDPRMGTAAKKTRTNLLTGSVVCGCNGDGCGSGMTTTTGKSGQYRYYSCHRRASQGNGACSGRRIRMEKLDGLVLSAIRKEILQADRLTEILEQWLHLTGKLEVSRKEKIRQLKSQLARLQEESANLIKLIRTGVIAADDSQIGSELAQIASQKASIAADIDLMERQSPGRRQITPQILAEFGKLVRRKLDGEHQVQKGYIDLLVDSVEVGIDQVRISGSKENLARLAASSPFFALGAQS